MSYKTATICLGIFLGVFVLWAIGSGVVLQTEWSLSKLLSSAFKGAVSNETACNTPGVICGVNPTQTPFVITNVPVLQETSVFQPKDALCATQLIQILSTSYTTGLLPIPPRSLLTVTVLNGPVDSRNIGWILVTDAVDTEPGQMWIIFRGSQTNYEWLSDFDWAQVDADGATVDPRLQPELAVLAHRGYVDLYATLQNSIEKAVGDFYDSAFKRNAVSSSVIISGHSLGVGLALMCANNWKVYVDGVNKSMPLPRVYVTAPPRVGNRLFVDRLLSKFGDNLYAIANDSDIVPTMPYSVQPNLAGGRPWLYAQLPLITFDVNWGSWDLNHMPAVYLQYLNLKSMQGVSRF